MNAAELAAALGRYQVRAAAEAKLQDAFAEIARLEGWSPRREHRLSSADIPDFFFPESGLAVELKTAGSLAEIERQLARYAAHDAVRELALVTTRRAHDALARQLGGKPVTIIRMGDHNEAVPAPPASAAPTSAAPATPTASAAFVGDVGTVPSGPDEEDEFGEGSLELSADGRVWTLRAEASVILRARRIFARAPQAGGRALRLTNTPEICRDLAWFIQRYPLRVRHPEALREGEKRHREREAVLARFADPEYRPAILPLAEPARAYQARAAETLLSLGHLLLGDDVGLGKTVSAIAALVDRRALPAAVVTLPFLPRQWERELARFAPHLRVHVPQSGSPAELRRSKKSPLQAQPDVYLLNYHKLAGWAPWLEGRVRCVVFDEIQELRRPAAAKYAAARALAAKARYRLGLSATPVYNYGGEFYWISDVLAPDALGAYEEFRREWCVGGDDKPRLADAAAFGAYLRREGLLLRRTRAQVGRELPPVSRIAHTIDADARALHRVRGSAAELARIILDRAGLDQPERRQRRFRAAGEFDTLLRQATGVAKAPYVADFVRLLVESGERVLLYGWHRAVYGLWSKKLADLRPRLFTGTESPIEKQDAVADFTAGRTPVLVMSLRSGAGVDGLQGVCRTVVFGELDWAAGVHEQCIGRVHRDGQSEPVSVYYLVAEDGADPVIADVLGLKREQVEGIRDPDAPLTEAGVPDPGRIERLATDYLRRNPYRVARPSFARRRRSR